MNLFRTPFFLPLLYPRLLWRIQTQEQEIYLTFDDGPMPGPTEFVLDTLEKWNAAATFFCIGDNVRKHPDLFRKVVGAGHRVGNHTFNHLSGWSTRDDRYLANIKQCADALEQPEASNQQSSASLPLFRPPYGRITQNQIRSLPGFTIVMWDVLTHDYSMALSSSRCLEGSLAAIRPGSIVVFHDSLKAERNMTFALPRMLERLSNLGYRFKSLP